MYDLDQFKETYITECFELLDEMEELLLQLDEDEPDIDKLHAIFRCAHSIKGGGGAFGFSDVVSFTHVLEALLEELRSQTLDLSQDIIDALLRSVDVVRSMIQSAQQGEAVDPALYSPLQEQLVALSDGSVQQPKVEKKVEAAAANANAAYQISFKPKESLFLTGNEPLLIIRELKELGELTTEVDVSALPDIETIDPEVPYFNWVFTLKTSEPQSAIEEVFEFVEDECDLEIKAQAIAEPKNEEDEFDGAGGIFTDAVADMETAKEVANDVPVVAEKKAPAPAPAAVQSIRVDIDKIDRLVNMVGEIVIAQSMITSQASKLSLDEHIDMVRGVETLSQYTRELQEAVMAVRMQPVKSIFSRMTRLVRDLSKELKKNIRLETKGETTEIDKTVIEQLSDPLTHMIRNSIDHGVESPEDRKKAGKPEEGLVQLSADQRGGRIIIEISDDGVGINRERVLAKAMDKGILPKDAQPTDQEIDELVFHPGFSTAQQVTNVSGRGVGMDVVRRNIEDLGGVIIVENTPGEGVTFVVSLPLTLAILDGMIIRVGAEYYIIPIANIIESIRPDPAAVSMVSTGSDVVNVRGEFIPLVYLFDVFNIQNANNDPSKALVILVESGNHKVGLVVDEMIGQQQVVVKSIEENTNAVQGVSGATILGDGQVSLILDIAKMYEVAMQNENQAKQVA